jgi:hypothetical protein
VPRLSFEGFLGLLITLLVIVLDQAGVRNGFVLWGAFALALLLCVDSVVRSSWRKVPKFGGTALVAILFVLFGGYLSRIRSVPAKAVSKEVIQESEPKSTKPPAEPKPAEDQPQPQPIPLAKPSRTIHNWAAAKKSKDRTNISPTVTQTADDVITQLAIFVDEGSQIQATFIGTDDAKKELEEGNEWATRANRYLLAHLGASYSIQFRNCDGSAWMGMPSNHSVEGGGYWQNIEGKKNCLNEFIHDLRRHNN